MSDQMAWASLYELALSVAERLGATVPDAAREVGRYEFLEAVLNVDDGWRLDWNGRPS
ncbi:MULTISPECIES: hypothetical protein [unclassified Streptomyces]|uniref:hypothetical protein n=1 Tax=unclassified Streptomyces TaxID=2593676 RepID=UPI00131D06EF|nr:hypothetical protein [Streptomyces sp. NRRL B-1347]